MSEEKRVSRKELTELLLNYNRCTPVTIVANTEVKMNKKKKFVLKENEYVYENDKPMSVTEENPYLGSRCRKAINGIINFDYQNAVNRQLVREGKESEFEVSERKWGTHVTKAIIEYKEKYYVQIRVGQTHSYDYRTSDGTEIEYSKLKEFITPKKKSDNQGTDKEIVIRDIKLDESVESITLDKVKYIVED